VVTEPVRIFLSYSTTDSIAADRLGDALRKEHFLLLQDRNRRGVRTGDSISEWIEMAVGMSDFFLVLLTKASVRSRWVQRELRQAMDRYDKGEMVILPVQVGRVRRPPSLEDVRILPLDPDWWDQTVHKLAEEIRSHWDEKFAKLNKTQRASRVKWFNDAKGFGFITQEGAGEDIFAHHADINMDGFRSLAEGQKVEFEIRKGPRGLQAANVRPL